MILMRANPLQRPLERVGPENLDFFALCRQSPTYALREERLRERRSRHFSCVSGGGGEGR
jgi:hypothetical protein